VRVLVVDIHYPAFAARHYRANPGLAARSYDDQLASLTDTWFGTTGIYTHHLNELGHEASEIVVNCLPLQLAWAREHGLRVGPLAGAARLPGPPGLLPRDRLLHRVARAQVEAFEPDVVYLQDLWFFKPSELAAMRRRGIRVAAQLGSQPPSDARATELDFVATSFPHFVPRLRAAGLDAEYLPLGFDARVLERLRAEGVDPDAGAERRHAVVFVGGIHRPSVHKGGTALLERLSRELDMEVWGYVDDRLSRTSPLLRRHHGEAWGLDMYRVLARARVAVNRHGDIAEGYANNMRLFEATGVGALLATEAADNLPDLFEPGREVLAYEGASDLIDQVRHHLAHEDERRAVAAAGQRRTLRDHGYGARIATLAGMLERRL
jgi:spore maturation protein CgeB